MKTERYPSRPIADIRENLVFAANGNLVLCYRVRLPEIYTLSERDFEELHGIWFQAFRSLPTGSVVHKQDIYRKRKFRAENLPGGSFLEKATLNYFKGRRYLDHEAYLFFTWPKNKKFNQPKFVNPFVDPGREFPLESEEGVQVFVKGVRDSVSYLNNSKFLGVEAMEQEGILGLAQDYFNGFMEDCDTDILLDSRHLQIGQHHFDILALNHELQFGELVQSSRTHEKFTSEDFVFHQGFADGLGLDLNDNHIVNQILYMDDRHKWRRYLEKRIGELKKSSNFGSQNKVTLERLKGILDRMHQDDTSRMVRGHLNVLYWDEDPGCLSSISGSVRTAFKEMDLVPYYPLGEERKNYFLNSFFCFSSNFSNADLYVADLKQALCLQLNHTNYKSDPSGILFNDRQHQIPVLKDVWDEEKKRIKARNFAIFAPTGEGKSFLANHILRQFFEAGVRLVIIDLGGSYSKFARLYEKDQLILRYEHGKNLGINPFFVKDPEHLSPQHLEDLTVFLLELTGSGEAGGKGREVALRKILRQYYQVRPSGHSLQTFYDFVQQERESLWKDLEIHPEYFDVEAFLHVMSEYVAHGMYHFLFEEQDDQSYLLEDKRLIIFELDEIRENKEILSVMLNLIKSAIQRTIWQHRSEKGIILFDEFAKQLKFPNVLESVEFYYQAIRKQNGAIGIVLQSISQLPENARAASILENTQVIYSLHNEKGYEQLQQRLHLSSHDLNQLRSIRNRLTGKRKYTEIFIKIGQESNIFRLEVPPEVYAAYLTDGKENEELMQLYAKEGGMEAAIKSFIKCKKR